MSNVIRSVKQSQIISIFRGNEAFFLLCLQVFVLHIGQSLIAPILPLYAQKFGVSVTLVGFLLTAQALPRIFTSLPAGRLADRMGANRLLVLSSLLVTVTSVVAGLAPNYTVLLITRLFQGAITAISMTAGLTYTANLSGPTNRARFMSLYQGSFLLGNSIGPMIGGFTAQYFSYRAPFFLYAALALIVGIWMAMRLPDSRSTAEGRVKNRKDQPSLIQGARKMLREPGVLLVCMIGFLATYTRAGSRNMAMPLLGEEIGLSESQIGLVFTLIFLMVVFSLVFAGTLADRFGTKAIIVPSWLFQALGLIIVVLAPKYGIFIVGACWYGLAAGIGSPVPVAYMVNVVDEESQGMALGVYRTFNDFGMLLGPILMGWIGDRSSIGTGVLINAGVVMLMAVIFFLWAPTEARKKIPANSTVQEGQKTQENK